MKKLVLLMLPAIVMALGSCNSGNSKTGSEAENGAHKVEVKEVIQTSNYTYLNVEENNKEQWIAVTRMEAKEGDVYYYDHFMEMKNFESKELERTFDSVYFIQELRTEPSAEAKTEPKMPDGHVAVEGMGQKPEISQKEIEIEPVEGGITIAELYANKEKYDGKKIIIRGKITNANFGIMEKNWFHIQDGTSTNDGFDLTITTDAEEIKVDDVVTFEGTITLNKDFGYGYKYDIIMEDGIVK